MGSVLVTGATGFTGGVLCRRLVEDGETVRAFVRSVEKAGSLERLGIDCRVVDIANPRAVNAHFDGVETVYHIAAAWRQEHAALDQFRLINVEATGHLLEAARRTGVRRFLHCSTVGVQGEIDDPPASEDYRFKPGDHYQESKMQGELLAREWFDKGLPGTVVRPVGIYGPGDTRFLKLFRPISRGRFVMIGSGRHPYHLTHVEDVVEGMLLAARKPEGVGEVFTIAGERPTTIRELVDLIADVLGRPRPRLRVPFAPVYAAAFVCAGVCRVVGVQPPIYPRRVDFFRKGRAFSIEKAKRLLGYRPRIGLREGLEQTAAWYRSEGWI